MMVREPPPLRIRPRLEVGDRAAQQPIVIVGLVHGLGCLSGAFSRLAASVSVHSRFTVNNWPEAWRGQRRV